ncbi:hypothetical protein [Psychroserpens sp. MEBiC05023]
MTTQQEMTAHKIESSPKENAQKVINALEREAKLDASQKNKVLDIFVAVEKKMKGISAIENTEERSKKKAKMQEYINSKLKMVLTPDQYELYTKKMAVH